MYDVSRILDQIKALSWAVYMTQAWEEGGRVLMGKREGNRRTRIWEDYNKMDLEEYDGMVWNELI